MLRYENALRGAMHAAAPTLHYKNGETTLPLPRFDTGGLIVDPNDPTDLARTLVNPNGYPCSPHQVLTSSLSSLHKLETTFLKLIEAPPEDFAKTDSKVTHEAHHAAYAIGARCVFGISIFTTPPEAPEPEWGWQLFCAAEAWTTTRLGAALWFGGPEKPSDGDIAGIRYLNYPNIRTLGTAAIRHGLPTPLSYLRTPLSARHRAAPLTRAA